jgi:hypothetical protein
MYTYGHATYHFGVDAVTSLIDSITTHPVIPVLIRPVVTCVDHLYVQERHRIQEEHNSQRERERESVCVRVRVRVCVGSGENVVDCLLVYVHGYVRAKFRARTHRCEKSRRETE